MENIEKKLLFFPTKTLIASPGEIGLKYDDLFLAAPIVGNAKTSLIESASPSPAAPRTLKINAWWIPTEKARATIIVSHGNGGNISHRLDKARIFHDLGLNVLLYDYRGYGRSEGEPSEKGVYADVQAAYDFVVKEKRIHPRQIISYGESLGGSVASHLAADNDVGALILDSTFTGLKDMAKTHYPLIAGLAQSNFDTLRNTVKVKSPVLIFHSSDDEVIPFKQGRLLFVAANEPKTFIMLRGGHNDGFLKSEKVYVRGLADFLALHFPRENSG